MAGGTKSFEDFASSFGFGAAPSAPEPAKQDMGGFASEMGFSRPQTDAAAPGGQTQPVQQQEAVAQEQPVPEFKTLGRPAAEPMTVSEMGSQALQNVGPSAKAFGESLVQPFLQPKETVEALGQLGSGLYGRGREALGFEATPEQKAAGTSVDALGQMFKDRYGSKENAMRTFAEDPVGFFGDVSLLLSGGGGLAARAPGAIGQAGKAVSTAGRYADPLTAATQVPKAVVKGVTSATNIPAWWHTGSSLKSLNQAVDAGITGNPQFLSHLAGSGKAEDVVRATQDAISQIAQRRSDEYTRGMGAIASNQPLPFSKVDQAMTDAQNMVYHRGRSIDPQAERVLNTMQTEIAQWRADPNMVHNIVDFDKLKQRIRNVGYDMTDRGTRARKLVDDIANAAKDTIPDKRYRDVMEQYSQATANLVELNKELLAGRSTGAQIRKLLKDQDAAHKGKLMKQIAEINPDIPFMVAGQELRPIVPSGIRGQISGLLTGAGALAFNPTMLGAILAASPRVMGGVNYATGRVGGLPSRVMEKLPAGTAPAIEEIGRFQEMVPAEEEPRQQNRGGRIPRASGGRLNGGLTADQLMVAAERAKKQHGKGTESLLDEPDEHITRALEIAKRHI